MIRAGSLDKIIDVLSKTVAPDSYNQTIETWTTQSTVHAEVINEGGGEFYAAQKLFAETSVVFRIRFLANVTTLNRISYNGHIFQILHVKDVGFRHAELQLSCTEVV
jgi:SPP1 family predicted phage head-tail adaptor